jgi:DNA-binding CsgD family transcriptional regulator
MQAAAHLLNIFESLGHASFLLGNEREVLAYNKPAATYLGDGLVLRGNRLAATDRASDVRLQASIGIVLLSVEGKGDRRSVGIRRSARPPFAVHIHRLAHETHPKLLLVACDPELSPVLPAGILSDMFKLTPAEARVAVGIASGKQLAEIAAERRVKIETVRAHSKTVFSKTQTRGQAELAALVTRLAFLVPRRG